MEMIEMYNQDKNTDHDNGMTVITRAQDTNGPTRDVHASLVPSRRRTLSLPRLSLALRRRWHLFHPPKPRHKPLPRARTRTLHTPNKLPIERQTRAKVLLLSVKALRLCRGR